MELFDLYDKFGNKINKIMERGGTNLFGEYHLVTHVWIRNSKGEYLIQQRNKPENPIPYQWAATGGAVLSGENSIEATIRETFEELGIKLPAHDFRLLKRYVIENERANYISDLYLVELDLVLETLKLDEKEVKAVAYKSMEQIKQMIRNNLFWDYPRMLERYDYFDVLEKSK